MKGAWLGVIVATTVMAGGSTSAQQNDIALIDAFYAYHRDKTSYDSDKDVVVTLAEDVEFGPFWLAFQCSSDAAWFMNSYNNDWKPRQALPDDLKNLHDTLCAMRTGLPYLPF